MLDSPPDEATYWPPYGERTITITCHLCGKRFKATLAEHEIDENYIWLFDGSYSGVNADHWCNECDRRDQETITGDWTRR